MPTEIATPLEKPSGTDAAAAAGGSGLLVVIPAYNESARVEAVVRDVLRQRPGADVLVVDDGSTDDTRAHALASGAHVASHPFNLGYGAALETGYQFASSRDYQIVVQLDADGQHEAKFIDALVGPILEDRADVVVGSRFLAPSDYRSTFGRRGGSFVFGRLASFLIGRRITDPTSGFWAMNRRALVALTRGVLPHDYPDADVLIGMHYAGFRLAEVPVYMRSPEGRKSMHAGIRPLYYIFKMLLSMLVTVLGRRPRST
jgi:glycosyltransferase involved in cell wall biosynthesis